MQPAQQGYQAGAAQGYLAPQTPSNTYTPTYLQLPVQKPTTYRVNASFGDDGDNRTTPSVIEEEKKPSPIAVPTQTITEEKKTIIKIDKKESIYIAIAVALVIVIIIFIVKSLQTTKK